MRPQTADSGHKVGDEVHQWLPPAYPSQLKRPGLGGGLRGGEACGAQKTEDHLYVVHVRSMHINLSSAVKMSSLPLLKFVRPYPGTTLLTACMTALPILRKVFLPGSFLKDTMLRIHECPSLLHVWAGWMWS